MEKQNSTEIIPAAESLSIDPASEMWSAENESPTMTTTRQSDNFEASSVISDGDVVVALSSFPRPRRSKYLGRCTQVDERFHRKWEDLGVSSLFHCSMPDSMSDRTAENTSGLTESNSV